MTRDSSGVSGKGSTGDHGGEVFGAGYARLYDAIYADKDYQTECELLATVFDNDSGSPVRSVLDLGCGTGGHALRLADSGFTVVGVDRSQWMLDQARVKQSELGLMDTSFVEGDIRTTDVGRTFDAAIMMFAVLGYQIDDRDVRAALQNARRHLSVGALLVFDVWYADAVFHQGMSERRKEIPTPEGRTVLRDASGRIMDRPGHICEVTYRLIDESTDSPHSQIEERHLMRCFSRDELRTFLMTASFELARVGQFPDIDREPDYESWNVLAVARAT